MVGMTDRVGNTLQAMEERAKEEIRTFYGDVIAMISFSFFLNSFRVETVRRDLPSYSTTATKTRKIYDVESIPPFLLIANGVCSA